MAKSTRSKVKRAFRAKKRTEGVYAATEAARLQRLNAKLRALTAAVVDKDDGQETGNSKEEEREDVPAAGDGDDAEMVSPTAIEGVEAAQKFKGKVSTHGPRGSRREQWRVSKGMAPRAKSKGMNRQGATAARYKSGRPQRRR
ncbi:hypothetical protein EDB84DRAFT_1450766 [Lactarius hengduanensis]|nr:hypothetical protein EDB84DRAFT_1450766 [Lactarius hengduanensis]